jgi:thiol-disulfide isomerase/thioredoxin
MANNKKSSGGNAGKKKSAAAARREARIKQEKQKKLIMFAGIGAVVALVVGFAVLSGGDDAVGETDSAAWDLPVIDEEIDGPGANDDDGRVTLTEFSGKPVVVNFFASWCTSCESELPVFRAAVDQFGDEVNFVFVNSTETGNWRPMAERTGIIDQTIVTDIGGTNRNGLYRDLGGTGGLPMTAFYEAEGNLIGDAILGEFNPARLLAALDEFYGVRL